jgi:hypothetical protein
MVLMSSPANLKISIKRAVFSEHGIVRPGVKALAVAQDRTREKQFVTELWRGQLQAQVTTLAELKAALKPLAPGGAENHLVWAMMAGAGGS